MDATPHRAACLTPDSLEALTAQRLNMRLVREGFHLAVEHLLPRPTGLAADSSRTEAGGPKSGGARKALALNLL